MAGLDCDVAVIGSGFGGSVAALRLTEKGYRVAVLEARQRFDDPSRDASLDRAPGRPGRRPGRAARASVAGPPALAGPWAAASRAASSRHRGGLMRRTGSVHGVE